MDIKNGDVFFGKWEVVEHIGSGNFGSVYEIVRKEYDKEYHSAMKVITLPDETEYKYMIDEGATDEQIAEFFNKRVKQIISELDLMSKLKGNSNIVSYEDHDIVKHNNGIGFDIFIRMELLCPLTEYVNQKGGNLDVCDIIKIGIDICHALESCEKRGIIHRDIKPQNIFVSDDDNFKLGDFGVARQVESGSLNMTRVGTCKFIAPEVFNGEVYGSVADIYSLGLVLYYYLNNRCMPFASEGFISSFEEQEQLNMKRIKGVELPEPINGSAYLKKVILKSCRFDPNERYKNAAEFRIALQQVLDSDYWGSERTLVITQPRVSLDSRQKPNHNELFNKVEKAQQEIRGDTDDNNDRKGKSNIKKVLIIASVLVAFLTVSLCVLLHYRSINAENQSENTSGSVSENIKLNFAFDSCIKRSFYFDNDGKTITLGELDNGKIRIYADITNYNGDTNNEVENATTDRFYLSYGNEIITINETVHIQNGKEIIFAVNDYRKDGNMEFAVTFESTDNITEKYKLVVVDPKTKEYNTFSSKNIEQCVSEKSEYKYIESQKKAELIFCGEKIELNNIQNKSLDFKIEELNFNINEENLPLGISFVLSSGSNSFDVNFFAKVNNGDIEVTKAEFKERQIEIKTTKATSAKPEIISPLAKNNSSKLLYDSNGKVYGIEVVLAGTLTVSNLKGGDDNLLVWIYGEQDRSKNLNYKGIDYYCDIMDYDDYYYSYNIDNLIALEDNSKGSYVSIYDGEYELYEDDENFADIKNKVALKESSYEDKKISNVLTIKKNPNNIVLTLKFSKSFDKNTLNSIHVSVTEGLFKTENGLNSCEYDEWFEFN